MTQETDKHADAKRNASAWLADIRALAARLTGPDADDAETAREEALENTLCSEVRSGWRVPGRGLEEAPEEYRILLSTGGPALQVYGRLYAHGEPESADLQWRDWGTPWTRYLDEQDGDGDALLAFARCFYFGEG